MAKQHIPRELPPEGADAVELTAEPPKPTRGIVKKLKLKPKERRKRDIHVQSDGFVRKNLTSEAEVEGTPLEYDVPQFVMGQDPETGEIAVVDNPEYDPALDPVGKLKILPMSTGPKVGSNGQFLPSRYVIKAKAQVGTKDDPREHNILCVRQDN